MLSWQVQTLYLMPSGRAGVELESQARSDLTPNKHPRLMSVMAGHMELHSRLE